MLSVSLLFQRSIFVLATLSAVILAMGEGVAFPNVLTIPLAIVAYILTVQKKTLYLPNAGANVLAMTALFFAGAEWAQGEVTADMESVMLTRLVSGTHLLIYLMWIVLFQRKTNKQYWWMFALSLLQVSVGSVLTESGTYGLMLFAYLIGAIWTLSLFTLNVAREDLIRPAGTDPLRQTSPHTTEVRQAGSWTSNTGVQSIVQPSRVVWENQGRGWKQRAIDFRFVVGVCGTAFASLGVAMLFFLLVPRMWIGRLPVVRAGTASGLTIRLTGFSDEVNLGSMGQILESNERVLFVRMFAPDGTELNVYRYANKLGYDEPLFRGAVLGTYEDGRWVVGRFGNEPDDPRRNEPPPKQGKFVRQEYRSSLKNANYLFAVHPVVRCRVRGGRSAGYQHFSAMLQRHDDPRKRPNVEYTVYSPESVNGEGPPVIRLSQPLPQWALQELKPFDRDAVESRPLLDQCRNFPNENGRLSRLESLAEKVAGYDAVPGEQPGNREMARRLESYLRDSGEYGYSLNSSIVDIQADPVEDFLFNRKQGHCEYFAASLALMLRAVDIPSRMVNGFKGGEVNRLTGEFYVEQRHAHAWVEALIDGNWETLDATPAAARSESVAGLAPAVDSWDDLVNMFKDQWSTKFVSMTFAKQKESFYAPIQRGLSAGWNSLAGKTDGKSNVLKSIGAFLSSPQNWISWQGGVATATLLSLITLFVWGIRWLLQRRGKINSKGRGDQVAEQIRVEFYERFRAICQSLGLIRGSSQTEKEFLISIDPTLRPKLAAAGLETVPGELVRSFYEVRFGGHEISRESQQRFDTQLSALEKLSAEMQKSS